MDLLSVKLGREQEDTMSWFIVQCERRTWTKYIVTAEDEEAAFDNSDNWHYLGYVDGEDTESIILGGPFETELGARADIVSYVEG